jgi:tripartite-type tricarboxylate transporter receptor subunit TctC
MDRRKFLASGSAAVGTSLIGTASGCSRFRAVAGNGGDQSWPRRPLTILVPFDVGGSADRLSRGFAQYMPKYLGQPMTVVDRAGASGMIGANWLLQQPADGYTVMMTPATPYIPINIIITNAHFTLDDFTFVNAQWTDYSALIVAKDRPWRTAGELIDAIRANPGKISTGVDFGSVGHIETLAMLESLNLKPNAVRFVTFDGSGAMHAALAGGQLDFYIGQSESNLVIRDYVRTLAVFLDHRAPDFPDAPPINDVLKPYNASVPLIAGSVRTFVFPSAFKVKHPVAFAKFVSAYRATLDAPEFKKFLHDNQMAGDWVGEERTTQTIRDQFEVLSKYKGLLKKS